VRAFLRILKVKRGDGIAAAVIKRFGAQGKPE
jgi:hypothetical protein